MANQGRTCHALADCDTIASALIRPENLETVIDYLTKKDK